MVTPDWIRPGATVIDVGINHITDEHTAARLFANSPARLAQFREKRSALVGDVHPGAIEVAGALTPVPGGVGPLTIAMLMSNTVRAARMRHGHALGDSVAGDSTYGVGKSGVGARGASTAGSAAPRTR
jgi:methylenetetrahydrofolate dehydrogenase (NADP+)/methenyltetrahydrofolate cyclohydrolase